VAEYDLLGRPKRTQYGVNALGQAESTVTYDYYDNDLPKQANDSQAGNQAFTYDAYDRLRSTTGPTGTVSYDYDAGDRRTRLTAAGTSTTYGYDTSDILTSVTPGTQEVTFGLDAVGREKTASLPGGVTRTTGYDTTGVITSIAYAQGSKTIGDLTYTRDQRALQTGLTGSLAKVALPAAETGTQFGKDNRITSCYYDPQTGRFISQDPSGQAGGTNLYQYALASPTTYTDPTGNNPMIAGCVIGGLMDGGLDWLTQRLSGRKVNWGQVGQSAAIGYLSGMLGEGLGAMFEGRLGSKLGSCALPNSFTGDTPVLMADGTRKPIKDVAIGDTVIATDPETGDTGPRKVTALIKGNGDKQLVDITLDTDGPAGTKTGTITATDGHPFWVPQLHQWVNAGDLKTGQWLQTSSGTWIQITVIRHHTQQTSVYNLTIDGLHTYYVGYGQAVLVHNAEPGCGPHLALGLRNIRGGQQGLLDEFARGLGAIAYQDPMFKVPIGGVMTEPMVKDMIDLVVSRGGRMTFNMHGITKVDEMLAGGDSYVATRVTAMELPISAEARPPEPSLPLRTEQHRADRLQRFGGSVGAPATGVPPTALRLGSLHADDVDPATGSSPAPAAAQAISGTVDHHAHLLPDGRLRPA